MWYEVETSHSKEGCEKHSRCGVRGPKRNKQKTLNIAIGGGSSEDIALGTIIGASKSRFWEFFLLSVMDITRIFHR